MCYRVVNIRVFPGRSEGTAYPVEFRVPAAAHLGSYDQTLKIWDLEGGTGLARFAGESALLLLRCRSRRPHAGGW